MEKIISNIIQVRTRKGYSQENMAEGLGIKQATYSRIENEETELTLNRLQKIADVLETDVSAFFKSSGITVQSQSNIDYVKGHVENLDAENRETAKKLVQALEDYIRQLKEENNHLKQQIEFLQALCHFKSPMKESNSSK
jgi:transcriptional regulator with XRE-family HTH domain